MRALESKIQPIYFFGPYAFAPERHRLTKGDTQLRIGGRASEILALLLERAGEVVSKHELFERVWPHITVNDSNLKVNIATLRRVLEDRSGPRAFIQAVPGRGYKFTGQVQISSETVGTNERADLGEHNLPSSTTQVIGREDDISSIFRELETSKMVSIVGPGGVGKTTVALEIAVRALGRYADGIWMVDFASLKEAVLVPNSIALAMGFNTVSTDATESLVRHLARRKTMLLLDNCEHLGRAIAETAACIIARCPEVTLLATSREPLGIGGERVQLLSGLQSPAVSSDITADTAMHYPAIRLFVDRASDRLGDFDLDDANARLVGEICRKLDGLPLAIELAAMRIDVFGVGGILRQLDDQLHLLTARRGVVERHRTLTATVDWSYGLLNSEEATVLRALSVFASAFDIAAVSTVMDISEAAASRVLDELVAKSLLSVEQSGAMRRHRLLETTRVYCLDRLRENGEEQTVKRRHAYYICTLLERAADERPMWSATKWGEHYKHYLDDLRAALDWSQNARNEHSLLIRLTLAGDYLWNHLSITNERCQRLSAAIERMGPAWMVGSSTEMKLQSSLAWALMFARGMVPLVKDALQRALEISLMTGDADYHLRTLRMIAGYQVFVGEHVGAIDKMKSFLDLADVEDPDAVPVGLTTLALAEVAIGRLTEGRNRVRDLWSNRTADQVSKQYARFQLDQNSSVAIVLSWAEWLTGSPERALTVASASVDIALETGHEFSLGNALAVSACPIAYWTGNTVQLEQYLQMLEDYTDRNGLGTWRPVLRIFRSAISMAPGDPSYATETLAQAIEDLRAMNHFVRMPYYQGILATALLEKGSVDQASVEIGRALEKAEMQNEKWCLPELLRMRAQVMTAKGQHDASEMDLIKAISLAEEIGALSWRLRAASDLATALSARSYRNQAENVLRPAYLMFKEGFETVDLRRAKTLLDHLDMAA